VIAFCISAMATPAEHERVVRQFVTDFSAGAIDKMLDAVRDEVELMSVDGAKANLDLTGKRALREYLTRDFARSIRAWNGCVAPANVWPCRKQ
jgi:hypothetical protein